MVSSVVFPREKALIEASLIGKVDWFKIEEPRPGEVVIKLWSALGFIWEDIQRGVPKFDGLIIRFEDAKAPLLTRVMSCWRKMRMMLRVSKSMTLKSRLRIARRCWKNTPGRHYESAGELIRDSLRLEGYRRRVLPPRMLPPPELFPPEDPKP